MGTETTADELNSLADKLRTLDLTDGERSLLNTILARAKGDDDEVGGFVYDERKGPSPRVYDPGPSPEGLAEAAGVRHVL